MKGFAKTRFDTEANENSEMWPIEGLLPTFE